MRLEASAIACNRARNQQLGTAWPCIFGVARYWRAGPALKQTSCVGKHDRTLGASARQRPYECALVNPAIQ